MDSYTIEELTTIIKFHEQLTSLLLTVLVPDVNKRCYLLAKLAIETSKPVTDECLQEILTNMKNIDKIEADMKATEAKIEADMKAINAFMSPSSGKPH